MEVDAAGGAAALGDGPEAHSARLAAVLCVHSGRCFQRMLKYPM